MIQWGPGDYSMNIGRIGEKDSPEIKAAERKVFETALNMGVPPRAEIGSVDQARYYLDMGVRHFCIGTDISILHSWWQTHGDALRKAIEE
jgi:4-hydroxy-2-oxoheptanedioate aldolase